MTLCLVASGLVVPSAARAAVTNEQRSARATTQPVGVIAPAGSRLAGELKREIAAANLTSVSIVTGDRDWPAEMTDLVSLPYLQGVVVGSDDGRMIVFSRGAASGRVEVRFELRFDPNDRPARRRACLAVVESLRVLGEASPPPPAASDDGERDAAEPAGAQGPLSTPTPVLAAGSPTPSAAAASRSPSGSPAAMALASASASKTTSTSASLAAASAPSPATTLASAAVPPAPVPEIAAVAPAANPPSLSAREPWVMGVATMLDVDRALGAPMGHLQFVWFIPIAQRFAFRVQAMWPLMGTQLHTDGGDVSVWTFGAALGLQYALARPQARLRPFVGIATGSQILLTDTSAVVSDKGRALFVPSANLRAQWGVRYAIASRVQLLGEIEATRDWLLQSARQNDYRDSAANTVAFHASLGVLFEY